MHIAILTFEGFNELDSLIALGILNRVKRPGWRVSIASPADKVRSMNGVVVEAQASLADARDADAVLVGSGIGTRDVVADAALMSQLRFDPTRQLLGAQCSGTLILARLGLLNDVPACTDLTTRPWVEEAGVAVLNAAVRGEGKRRDRRRVPGVAVSGGLVHRASGRRRGCPQRDSLCGASGGEGDLRVARDGEYFAVPLMRTEVSTCSPFVWMASLNRLRFTSRSVAHPTVRNFHV